MPKTKLESVVFSAMMVFCMVFSMTCYTGALRAGGVTYGLFAQSIREMWIEFAFVFLLVFFGVSRIAPRIALKLLHPTGTAPDPVHPGGAGADGLHGRPGGDAVCVPAPRRRKPGLFPTLGSRLAGSVSRRR